MTASTAADRPVRRIVVVDDHPVVCEGVRRLLAEHADLQIVAEADEPAEAVRLTAQLRPDAVILDLRMGGRFVPRTAADLKAVSPTTKVLIHTSAEEDEPVHAALRAGADGVAFKDQDQLVPALRAVLASVPGQRPREPRRDAAARRTDPETPVVARLSPREYDMLHALARGWSTKEIAQELHLAESTVRSYTKALLTKLGVRSRIEALAVARRAQLL